MFQSGVFMSSQKYQGLLDQVNRQKLAIDNEKVSNGENMGFIITVIIAP